MLDPLNIGGSEWIVIVFVALVLIFGTSKLPDAAKKLGQATNEFNKARKGIESQVNEMTSGTVKVSGPVENERQKFEVIARSLGINPDGMPTAELQKAITEKVGYKDPVDG